MNCQPTLVNTYGEELLLSHIDRFTLQYPAYAKRLADAVVFFAADMTPISPSKLQRRYHINYTVADEMVKALKSAKAIRHLHEPIRDELCLEKDQSELLSDYILSRVFGSEDIN